MKIRFLTDGFGNSKGETVKVKEETEGELYYYDGFDRWCYLFKHEEGKSFEYVKKNRKQKGMEMSKFIITNECVENGISIGDFCEHCCVIPEQPLLSDGCTSWCLDCAFANGLSDSEYDEILVLLNWSNKSE